jgi:DNA-binding response OmpR family regulator
MAALYQLRKHRMPVVLMDVHMPRMNGLDATRDIKQDPDLAKTVVIAVSASVFADTQQRIFEAGCDDFIGKPVRRTELFEKIERHLRLFASKDAAELSQPLSQARDEFSKRFPVEIIEDVENQLRNAAEVGNVTTLNVLVEKLSKLHNAPSTYVEEIRRLIRSFDFDEIVKLTQGG